MSQELGIRNTITLPLAADYVQHIAVTISATGQAIQAGVSVDNGIGTLARGGKAGDFVTVVLFYSSKLAVAAATLTVGQRCGLNANGKVAVNANGAWITLTPAEADGIVEICPVFGATHA